MSAIENQAATFIAPYTNGTDDSNELLLLMKTNHAAMTFPEEFEGCTIEITCRGTAGKSGWFLCSHLSTAEVDRTIAATVAGATSPKLGRRVVVGETKPFTVPVRQTPAGRVYLIHETDEDDIVAEISIVSTKVG